MTRLQRLYGAALVFGVASCFVQAAYADPGQAVRWLERVSQAARTLNYEGVFVYQHKGGLEAMRIIHRAQDGNESERLYSLTGAPREIIRDDEKVTCILPNNRSIVVDRRQIGNPLSQLVPRDAQKLSRAYDLDVTGEGRVADRAAAEVSIIPKDEYRFGYRLWIDQATGLLLQADVFDSNGKRIEQLMFTELRTPDSIEPSSLEPQLSGDAYSWRQEEPVAATVGKDSKSWQFNDLPAGFELVLHEARPAPSGGEQMEHLLFSDGLASVSVYIEKTAPEDAFRGYSEMGAVKAFGRLVGDTTQVTAVGEVPRQTVERISAAIEQRDAGR